MALKTRNLIGYDLKRVYQRNLLVGALVANGPLLCLILFHLVHSGVSPVRTIMNEGGLREVAEGAGGWVDDDSGQQSQVRRWRQPAFPSGNLGKIRIVRDRPEPELSVLVSGSETPRIEASILAVAGENDVPGGFADGGLGLGGGDFGLPPDEPYLPEVPFSGSIAGPGGEIKFSKPGVAIVASPRWPEDAKRDDTGRVVLRFMIFKNGTISSWDDIEVLSESPRGRGFARCAKNAVFYDGFFKPRLIDGEFVDTRVTLTIVTCRLCENMVGSSSDMILISQRER